MSSQIDQQPLTGSIDPTDVPAVALRELATALKVLSEDRHALMRASEWTDDDFRRVEQYFWQRCARDNQRKIAALVRLRCMVEACRARTMQTLMAEQGEQAITAIIAAAAAMRLNISVGFSPIKLVCNAKSYLADQFGGPDLHAAA